MIPARKTARVYFRENTRARRAAAKAEGRCQICFDSLAHPDHPSMCRDCRNRKNEARKAKA